MQSPVGQAPTEHVGDGEFSLRSPFYVTSLGSILDHEIHNRQQLAHACGDDNLVRFTVPDFGFSAMLVTY